MRPTIDTNFKSGAGCLTLFALPFAAVGVFVGYMAIKQFTEGPAFAGGLGLLRDTARWPAF